MDGNEVSDCIYVCGESDCNNDDCSVHCRAQEAAVAKAYATLPENMEVIKLADGTPSVIAKSRLPAGTQFGPLIARRTHLLPPEISFPLKVFKNTQHSYYYDTTDINKCNWMCLVAPAANPLDQNMICYQLLDDIYFSTMRIVQKGEELRVWYAPSYAEKMGMQRQAANDNDCDAAGSCTDHTYRKTEAIPPVESTGCKFQQNPKGGALNWKCCLCSAYFATVVSYSTHLMEHYKPFLAHKENSLPTLPVEQEEPQSENSSVPKGNVTSVLLSKYSHEKGETPVIVFMYSDKQHPGCIPVKEVSIQEENIKKILLQLQGKHEVAPATVQNFLSSFLRQEKCDVKTEDASDMRDATTSSNNSAGSMEKEEFVLPNSTYQCDLCKKTFKKINYLYRHLRKHTGEFTCPNCYKVFSRKENLMLHICSQEMTPSSVLSCPVCFKKFTSERLLERHVAKHPGQHKCEKCNNDFSSKEELLGHLCIKMETEDTCTYDCNFCGKKFTEEVFLEKHLPCHTLKYPCSVCGKALRSSSVQSEHECYCKMEQCLRESGAVECCVSEFRTLHQLWQHIHEHSHSYFCKLCLVRFKTHKQLNSHVCQMSDYLLCDLCDHQSNSLSSLYHHQKDHEHLPEHHCFECGRMFYVLENKIKHICDLGRTEPGEIRQGEATPNKRNVGSVPKKHHVCELCGQSYQTVYNLRTHMLKHGSLKKFKCDICGKGFHRKDLLQEHQMVHQDAAIQCQQCGKLVKTKKSLDTHMLIHYGIKQHVCKICGKEFIQKGNLRKHLLVHEPDKSSNVLCTYCGKSFASKEYLVLHALEHTQGRTFVCDICGRGFVKEHLLNTHRRQYHTSYRYACPYCSLSVRLRASMRKHLEKRHASLQGEWDKPKFLDNLQEEYIKGKSNSKLQSQQIKTEAKGENQESDASNIIAESLAAAHVNEDMEVVANEIVLSTDVAGVDTDEVPISAGTFILENGSILTQHDEENSDGDAVFYYVISEDILPT